MAFYGGLCNNDVVEDRHGTPQSAHGARKVNADRLWKSHEVLTGRRAGVDEADDFATHMIFLPSPNAV